MGYEKTAVVANMMVATAVEYLCWEYRFTRLSPGVSNKILGGDALVFHDAANGFC